METLTVEPVKIVPSDTSAEADINKNLSKEEKVELLRKMVQIRRFEQVAYAKYQGGKMSGFIHLYIGQESVAVGTCSLMGEHDHVITAYRCHGHASGRRDGHERMHGRALRKGYGMLEREGGSMHFFAPDKNYWGGHGIVAGQTPLGLGLAYGIKYKGLKGAALCFLGDGAVNQGVFYESLNMASLMNLPIIYIIENNRYSMGTSLERSSVIKDCLAQRGESFGVDWALANGQDVNEVRAVTQKAIERAHNDSRPTILEFDTYRHYGHSVADSKHKGGYRTAEEIEVYKKSHDPLQIYKAHLLAAGLLTEDEYTEINNAAKAEADASAKFAEESPLPDPSSIFEDVYFEVDRNTEAGRSGKHFFND